MHTASLKSIQLSLKAKAAATAGAIAGAVILPQIFHMFGALSGIGTSAGEVFLPMHLPIILVGLLAGPAAGAIAGFTAPLISLCLSGMPLITMLPFMTIELCAYGTFAGILKNTDLSLIPKVFITQIAGRIIKAIAIAVAIYIFGNETLPLSSVLTSAYTGILGIALQLTVIPLVVFAVENSKKHEQ